MVFTEPFFLFLFLPATLLAYLASGARFKNATLLFASFAFYGLGQPQHLLLLLASIALNWIAGLLLERATTATGRRAALAGGIAANLLVLGWYKYAGFLVENLNGTLTLFGCDALTVPQIVLPVGISFFTFQAISYLVDVYRGEARSTRNAFDLALYIALFPQLVAGPIVRFASVADAIRSRRVGLADVEYGARRFIVGFAKKVLIANTLAGPVDAIWKLPPDQITTSLAWAGSGLYALQIYFDFSGYSDMAIGLGRLFGFRFDENFAHPYVSRSITEFWRRWHISLSSWFRDYVYIPLGGNRQGRWRTCANLTLVFFLCGFWHGASWLFVAWGLYQGVFLILERAGLGRGLLALPRPFQHAYALLVTVVGWTIFRSATGPNFAVDADEVLWAHLAALCGGGAKAEHGSVWDLVTAPHLVAAAVGAVFATPVWSSLERLAGQVRWLPPAWAQSLIALWMLVLFGVSAMSAAANTYSPFLYFQF
jgi:alginate O-acetyltransferase complex protein AlgI